MLQVPGQSKDDVGKWRMGSNRLSSAVPRGSSLRRAVIALLLTATAIPLPLGAPALCAQQADPAQQTIIITAPPIFRDIQPERLLDREGIDSYGVSTIDELLSEVQAELGNDDDPPLIIVNGERLNSIDEIGALPVEALRDLIILPRGSAVRSGGTASQRVVSLTLRSRVRSATLTAASKIATKGDWHSDRGEAILTSIKGSTRANLTLRARNDSILLESERGIIQPDLSIPYALGGNLVGFPNSLGEIDPALSAAAGEIVTVVPLPRIPYPSLSDLIAEANQPAVTDRGEFRSLRPKGRNYDLNGTFSARLAPWLTSSATIRLNRSSSLYLRGLPSAIFVLAADNAASPFSRDVGIAAFGANPLRSRSRRSGGEGNLTLDATIGRWKANFNARHNRTRDVTTSQRVATFGPITLDDSFDPFGADLTGLIDIRHDRATARAVESTLELTFNGPLLKLPAGDLLAVVEGRLDWKSLTSASTFSLIHPKAHFRRNEQAVRASVDIPLTSRENDFLDSIGDLRGVAEYTRFHYSDAGTLGHHALGLIWDPVPMLQLRASIDRTEIPAPIQALGNPVIITPGVRVFDPLTGETVDVTQVTGGNPDALPQTTRVRRLAATVRLVPEWNLQFDGEYTDTDRRDFLSSLPESSAAIMLAFPDRFVRDVDGTLVRADLRPVNFDSEREKRFRWGFNMSTRLGRSADSAEIQAAASGQRAPVRPPLFLQLNANHSIVFVDRIVIRPGLPPVDLLRGGAIGIGGGRARHQFDATASLSSGGLGARLGFNYRGRTSLLTRLSGTTDVLRFLPQSSVNLRLFAEGRRVIPKVEWAKGLRLTLNVTNLFDNRKRVRDSFGETPLQYQPAYLDPIGRTVEFEIRSIF